MLREAPWTSNACKAPSNEVVCGAYDGGGEASSLVPAPGPSVVVTVRQSVSQSVTSRSPSTHHRQSVS